VTAGLEDVDRYDLATGTLSGSPIRLELQVGQMQFSPNGRTLVIGGVQGSLAALDTGGRTFYEASDSPLTSAALNPAGYLAAPASLTARYRYGTSATLP
jgi:hypothetical protein